MKTYRISVLVNKAGSKKAAGTISGAARSISKHFGGSTSFSTRHDMYAPDVNKGQVVTILIDGPDNMDDLILAAAVRACSQQYEGTVDGDIIMYGGVRAGSWFTRDEGWSPNGWRPLQLHCTTENKIEVRHMETGVCKIGQLYSDYTWINGVYTKVRPGYEYEFTDGSKIELHSGQIPEFEFREVR